MKKVLIIVLIGLTIVLSMSQTILYLWKTPDGYSFPLIHNFVEDYYQYLDIMRQGFDGWWGATSRMTPEVLSRFPVSIFLLLLGHLARLFHVSVPVMYTMARVGGGITLMALVYQLIKLIYPQSFIKRFTGLSIVLFSTYFWGWGSGGPIVAALPHAWTELDPIFRWSFVPHHLWSKVFMLTAFLLLLRPFPFSFFLLPFSVLVMGLTNPVVYVTFIPTLILYSVLILRRQSKLSFEMGMVAIALAVAGIVTIYHRYLQTNIFPWTSYLLWEKTLMYTVSPLEYAMSFGPTLLLFILAIPTLWQMGRVGSMLIAWASSSWIMIYLVGPFVPITPERFLGGYQFIPIGIGAAIWIVSLKRSHLFRLGIVVLLFCYFAVGLSASFREHAGYVAGNRNNPQVYVPNDLMDVFSYISKNSQPEDVVMAPYEISTMIPGLTGRRVVAGHVMFTKDVGVKRAAINEFFTTRDPAAYRRILSQYNVKWILTQAPWRADAGQRFNMVLNKSQFSLFVMKE